MLPAGVALCAAIPAAGQETGLPTPGSRTVDVYGIAGQGFHQELSRGQGFSEFGGIGLAAAQGVSRKLELSLDFHPLLLIRQPEVPPHGRRETVASFALDVGLRWSPVSSWRGLLPYGELLAGPFYSVRRVPARGTRFNFLTQTGVGVVRLGPGRWNPYVAARWVHISNAGTGEHNPDWDYWALAIGGRLRIGRP